MFFAVSAFSQEKVRIKGFYEESYNRLEVEDSYKDTTIYRKLGFKEAWKKKKFWTPWSKVEIKRNKINNYDQSSSRYMLNVSYDDIIADSVWCTNQAIVTTAFPLDIQVLLDKMGEKFTFDGIREKAKFYTKENNDFYLYRLYQFDGYALRYSYTWDEIKASKTYNYYIDYVCIQDPTAITRIPVTVKGYVAPAQNNQQNNAPRMMMPKRAIITQNGTQRTTTLTATLLPENASDQHIDWFVTNADLTLSKTSSLSGEAITLSVAEPFLEEIHVTAKARINHDISSTCVIVYEA